MERQCPQCKEFDARDDEMCADRLQRSIVYDLVHALIHHLLWWLVGATVARTTPDRKVVGSNPTRVMRHFGVCGRPRILHRSCFLWSCCSFLFYLLSRFLLLVVSRLVFLLAGLFPLSCCLLLPQGEQRHHTTSCVFWTPADPPAAPPKRARVAASSVATSSRDLHSTATLPSAQAR